MRFSIEQIRHYGASKLVVHSFESGIYLVEAVLHSEHGFVTDNAGANLKFNCVNAVKKAFKGVDIDECWLVGETPYDEMVGCVETNKQQLCIPFSLS